MEYLFDVAMFFSIGIIAFVIYRYYYLNRASKELQEFLQGQVQKFLEESVHNIKEEEHEGMTFWYDQDSGGFLAQGIDEPQLIQHVQKRFPNHIFIKEGSGVMAESTGWTWAETVKVENVAFFI